MKALLSCYINVPLNEAVYLDSLQSLNGKPSVRSAHRQVRVDGPQSAFKPSCTIVSGRISHSHGSHPAVCIAKRELEVVLVIILLSYRTCPEYKFVLKKQVSVLFRTNSHLVLPTT